MFTLHDGTLARTCQGFSRREFLRIGGLGLLGGLTLPDLLRARARRRRRGRPSGSAPLSSCSSRAGRRTSNSSTRRWIAPADVRSMTGEVQTALPGITFGGTFTKLAKLTDKLAVVRSYASMNGDHTYLSVTGGGNPLKAADERPLCPRGRHHAPADRHAHQHPGAARGGRARPEAERQLRDRRPAHADQPGRRSAPPTPPSTPAAASNSRRTCSSRSPPTASTTAASCWPSSTASAARSTSPAPWTGLDRFQQQAFDVIIARRRAGVRPVQGRPAHDRPGTTQQALQTGRSQQVVRHAAARRTCWASRCCWPGGCARRAAASSPSPTAAGTCTPTATAPSRWPTCRCLTSQVDHAVAAFLEDVHERGLSDKILLVVTGEMGRTPRRNRDGGRDHYANLTTAAPGRRRPEDGPGHRPVGPVVRQSDDRALHAEEPDGDRDAVAAGPRRSAGAAGAGAGGECADGGGGDWGVGYSQRASGDKQSPRSRGRGGGAPGRRR